MKRLDVDSRRQSGSLTRRNSVKRTLLLLSTVLVVASQSIPQTASPQPSAPGTARLIGIEDLTAFQPIGRGSYLGVYLLTLQDGQNAMKVLYRYALFQHDFTKGISSGMDIPYRLDGKHVYLKSQDGKEVKTALCEEKGDKLHCADLIIEPRKR
jgi:hypothetical protein